MSTLTSLLVSGSFDRAVQQVSALISVFVPGSVRDVSGGAWPHGLCRTIRFPVAPHKIRGPNQCICFLGIDANFVTQHLQIPLDKVTKILEWIIR